MYVLDLEGVRDFFVKYFGATANDLYHNPVTGFKSYFLTFGSGSRLEIMTRPNLAANPLEQIRSGYIHLAMSVGSKEKVDRLTGTLRTHGYAVLSGPRTTGDGCYESCILGPENNLIEITV